MSQAKTTHLASTPLKASRRARRTPTGYEPVAPQLPAVVELRRQSGVQDAFINLAELAIRHFERTMPSSGADAYVIQACKEVGVSPTHGSWEQARLNAAHYAVTQVASVADSFLRRLAREYRKYKNIPPEKWKNKDDRHQLDALAVFPQNLSKTQAKALHSCPEYDILDYFRLVRNRIIHRTDEDTDVLRSQLLNKHDAHLEQLYKAVPSTFAAVAHSDFLIFTRALKFFAVHISNVLAITPAEIAQLELRQPDFLAYIREGKGRTGTPRRAAENLGFKYRLNAEHVEELKALFSDFIVRDPSSRERRANGT